MIRKCTLALLLLIPTTAAAQDRLLGLLSLPEVFGDGPCERFTPDVIPIHAGPGSGVVVGAIRVDTYWRFPAEGGCEGLEVNVHVEGTREPAPLPTEEAGYEAPAAIVLERRGAWFRIRLPSGSGWIRPSGEAAYHPLEQLLMNGLAYVLRPGSDRLVAAPGGATAVPGPALQRDDDVQVTAVREVNGELWLHVEVQSHSICESIEPPTVTVRGWLRAHVPASGEPTVWFYSRGC